MEYEGFCEQIPLYERTNLPTLVASILTVLSYITQPEDSTTIIL
jgi:hypothetical protein